MPIVSHTFKLVFPSIKSAIKYDVTLLILSFILILCRLTKNQAWKTKSQTWILLKN